MQRGVPNACAAHREASQRHALRIDPVSLLGELDGFEDVGFTGPVISVLAATEQIDLNRARKVIDLHSLVAIERLYFIERGETPVLRDVEWKYFRAVVLSRNGDADGLHRSINSRPEAAGDKPSLRGPGRLTFL